MNHIDVFPFAMSDTPPDSKKGANLDARPEFDKTELYKKEIDPIVQALHAALLKHEIPAVIFIETARVTKLERDRTEITRDGIDLGSTGPNGYVPMEFMISRLVLRESGVFRRVKFLLEIAGVF